MEHIGAHWSTLLSQVSQSELAGCQPETAVCGLSQCAMFSYKPDRQTDVQTDIQTDINRATNKYGLSGAGEATVRLPGSSPGPRAHMTLLLFVVIRASCAGSEPETS